MPAWGRDGAALKRALAVYAEATIRDALPAYFADRRSLDRIGASIPLFVQRIGTLAGRRGPDLPDFTGTGSRRP
jgi:hypothetical protein